MRQLLALGALCASLGCAPKHLSLGLEAPASQTPELGDKAQVVITRTRKTAIALPLSYRFGKEDPGYLNFQDCLRREVEPGSVEIRVWMGKRITRVMFSAEAGKTYYFDGHDALGFPTNNAALDPKTPAEAERLMKQCSSWE